MSNDKIALVTDSSCDLPQQILEKFNIHLLPLKIIYKDREYDDRVEITPEQIYEHLSEEVPTTSQPSRGTAVQLLDRLKEQGYEKVLAVLISSGLSATYEMFENLKNEYADMDIRVVNSKSLSMGLGFLVMEGAKLLEEKKAGLDEIVEKLNATREKINLFYSLQTLEYLRRGGRIGLVAATIGSIIDLKPIISVNEEGKYYPHTRVRGRKKSIAKIVEIVDEITQGKQFNLAVMHGDAKEEAQKIYERFADHPRIKNLFLEQISPALVVHTGPGLLGLCYQVID